MSGSLTLTSIRDIVAGPLNVDLIDSPEFILGTRTFAAGAEFGNHYHEHFDEFFIGISGRIDVWVDRREKVELTAGTTLLCRRLQHHYLINTSTEDAEIAVVKVPAVPGDAVQVQWHPGDQQ